MAKKSFKENPALSFITQALEQQQAAPARAVPAPISDAGEAEAAVLPTGAEGMPTAAQAPTDKYTHTHDDTNIHADVYDDVHTQADTAIDVYADTAEETAAVFARAVPEAAVPTSEGISPVSPQTTSEMVGRTAASDMADGPSRPRPGRESKSKRLQLLLRPSTHDGIAGLARRYQTSVNDIINQVLEDYLKRNG